MICSLDLILENNQYFKKENVMKIIGFSLCLHWGGKSEAGGFPDLYKPKITQQKNLGHQNNAQKLNFVN